MKNIKTIFIAVICVFTIQSCTIAKRVHRSGYHIEWHVGKKTPKTNEQVCETKVKKNTLEKKVENINSQKKISEVFAQNDLSNINNNVTASANNIPVSVLKRSPKTINENKTKLSTEKHQTINTKKNNLIQKDVFSSNTTKEKKLAKKGGDNEKLIAVLLWFFLGIIGIHRFYLGYYGLGVLYLFTLAFFGIGWIVDGILFLLNKLNHK